MDPLTQVNETGLCTVHKAADEAIAAFGLLPISPGKNIFAWSWHSFLTMIGLLGSGRVNRVEPTSKFMGDSVTGVRYLSYRADP